MSLDDSYAARFDKLIAKVESFSDQTAFWPVIGQNYDETRLLVIGRACNGWGESGPIRTTEAARSESATKPNENVLSPSYVRRSAFWQVGRAILRDAFGVLLNDEQSVEWMHHLAWTNLFKVSPYKGWNPGDTVRDRIRDDCIDLLRAEIEQLKPKVVLVLAGQDWFHSFEQRLPLPLVRPQMTFVDGTARGFGAVWVVAKHPMRKPREAFVAEVATVLRELGATANGP